MSVSGISNSTANYPVAVENERAVLVLKKTQEATKDQGQALADLVKKTTETVGRIINVYA